MLWEGTCIVHEHFSEKAVIQLKTRYPDAHVIAHPECPEPLLAHAEHVGSTSSLLQFTRDHAGESFIVLTEPGIIHQMEKLSPGSTFYPVPGLDEGSCASCNDCPFMKLNTMEKLYQCMVSKAPEITLDETLRVQAKKALDRMMEMS